MEMEEQSPEYLKQLVLSSLTICCQNEEEDEPDNSSKGTSRKFFMAFFYLTDLFN